MKNRHIAIAAASAALALTLSGCSDSEEGATTGPSASGAGVSGSIKASGSSAQKNAMAEWINAFQTANPKATIEYQANGSGAGIQDFINKQTSFAGSDSLMKEDEKAAADPRCTGGEAVHIPMVGGAIAIAYNVEGVTDLTMTPDVLAGIFASEITKWNDPKIVELNPDATLPDATIAQFHRADESGTTQNFTAYLAATSPEIWTYGDEKAWAAPGGQGAKGSDGMASSLTQTPNSIAYVELSFTLESGVPAVKVDNGGGAVEATSENAAKAIESAEVVGTGVDLSLKLDPEIADGSSYPIVLVTYQITCSTGLPAAELGVVKPFFQYATSDAGQSELIDSGYVPITGGLLEKVRATVDSLA